jgi:ubiquinone/menaquinone biosynthesis C-methylase UbiE
MEDHPEIIAHYEAYEEAERLTEQNPLEYLRTTEIIGRYLADPPAIVVDVGGGPGIYAEWLVRQGYRVYLFDVVPGHVEAARRRADVGDLIAEVADARRIPMSDSSGDMVLLLGPLYHLVNRPDRIAALREACRVLKPGGVLLAAGISRFASAIDGVVSGYLSDPVFRQMVERALTDGQHRNPTANTKYFTTAFFHHPDELRRELLDAGLVEVTTLAVEGFGWAVPEINEVLENSKDRGWLLDALRRLETEPSLLGASPHLLGVGRAPGP